MRPIATPMKQSDSTATSIPKVKVKRRQHVSFLSISTDRPASRVTIMEVEGNGPILDPLVADSANTGRPSGSNIGPFPSTSIMVTRDAGRSIDMDKKETC